MVSHRFEAPCRSLTRIDPEEFAELGQIQARLTHLLYEELHCEKEYISCYAETEHFRHNHFHIFAKPSDLPDDLKGGRSFALLKVKPEEAVAPPEVIAFCELLKDRFDQTHPIRYK